MTNGGRSRRTTISYNIAEISLLCSVLPCKSHGAIHYTYLNYCNEFETIVMSEEKGIGGAIFYFTHVITIDVEKYIFMT